MECRKRLVLIYSLILALFVVFSLNGQAAIRKPAAAASTPALCQVKVQADWTREERDDARLNCIKKNRKVLSPLRCLQIAQGMEYAIEADDAKVYCLNELKDQPTLNECYEISNTVEFADTADEARWSCIRRFGKKLKIYQCDRFAKSMSYPSNFHRAQSYCNYEL
ncbi:hypothetical protein D3C72_1492770 [compost metagenome]